ncbi:MOSC domain-containing protein [Methylomicrobium sp. Wu6]|uniref:MOSC domain-containing protein n=1 Tax=Methylomicrobium sp. Wu6 TaxID=3107928 RepID=UPI002DD680CB|nr:MOSC domain-containing protein [Methylomicrobium sp. Wu6]
MRSFPATGELVWIGLRPARRAAMLALDEVFAEADAGLTGDRHHGGGKRQVTLIQSEHLAVLSSFAKRPVTPELLRRNLVIRGINLLVLKNRTFRIGEAVLQGTGQCHPCSRMENTLGPGGYNALRGHGGLTARILESGMLRVGDRLTVLPEDAAS